MLRLDPALARTVDHLCQAVKAAGGRALAVGGSVRDSLWGEMAHDVDLEVYGLEAGDLERLLRQHHAIDTVGRAFGVFKVRGYPIDVSLPRRESRIGSGHRDVKVEGNPAMPPEEAAQRRDFTINAIACDPLTGIIIDPCNGRDDLQQRRLRHTSGAFAEDPLRVLRGMQLIARFELTPAPETIALCATMTQDDLPPERLYEEWKKLIVLGRRPSAGLTFLKDCGWLRFYPELAALDGCPQDPAWHPEGDVWTHTLHCLDAFAQAKTGHDEEDLIVGLAVLCHDLGKPSTTFTDTDGRIRSPGHEQTGEDPTRRFIARLTARVDLPEAVVPLVVTHLRPVELYKSEASDAAIRRLARKVGRIDRLVRVAQADMGGRPPKSADFLAGPWLLERAAALDVRDHAPLPLILGRELIARGMKPGPAFKPILDACFEAQLEGVFTTREGGLLFLDHYLATPPPERTEG
jgi:tRNA nucleotidyltransferase (CCA-adding enzyme)